MAFMFKSTSICSIQGTHVPKFGNWEGDEAVDTVSFPYTQYFEKARKGRMGTKAVNADNPHDNPEEFHAGATLIHVPPLTSSPHQGGSPLHHDPIIHKHTIDSPNNRYEDQMPSGDYQSRLHQVGDGSDYKGNTSPLHPHYQMNNNVYSTSEGLPEGNYGSMSNSPGGLRMAGVGDENTIKKGQAVPKFGEWNEDLYMADGYSVIFSKVREDKEKEGRQTRPATVPNVPNNTTADNSQENSHESAILPSELNAFI
ncbi:hypothetical protein ZIOFF_066573 [Zingiber officinale]|uniref:RIN4 pathogenic type III effector avirulence factor Avr cleavage site domain-containing protein n=1 Tax=Zingiber officinale TaxID=94328 RepID=A0A8J5F0K3_ZINOF|nr:hypothetical protein ZIOFF_066573 [Zingiber officinale]